jgi:hypothetical protein
MEETVANDENDEMLLELTSERSQLMDDLRNRLLYDEATNVAERKSLYVSNRVFERVLWQLRQMLISKQQSA